MATKKCTKCGKILDLSMFYDAGKNNGKKKSECKECSKEMFKAARIRSRGVPTGDVQLVQKRDNVTCSDCRGLGVYCNIKSELYSTNLALYCNSFKPSANGNSKK